MERTDLLYDEDFEMQIAGGDFVPGLSDQQHIELLLLIEPGSLSQYPLTGVGITKYINGSGSLKRAINLQLLADGYAVSKLNFINDGDDNNIEIDATATN